MKTNKLENLFKNGLQGQEIMPSGDAVKTFQEQLVQRHRSRGLHIWIRVAGLLLFGAGMLWLANVMIRQERIPGNGINTVHVESGENHIAKNEKNLKMHDDAAIPMGENQVQPDKNYSQSIINNKMVMPGSEAQDNSGVSKSTVIEEKPVIKRKMADEMAYKGMLVEGKLNLSGTAKKGQKKASLEKDPGHKTEAIGGLKTIDEREIVPIKIVYKRSNNKATKKEKGKGLLKKGYKRVAAVFDRMDIKKGAKDKLQKTRDELVAMNPVRLFKKDENR